MKVPYSSLQLEKKISKKVFRKKIGLRNQLFKSANMTKTLTLSWAFYSLLTTISSCCQTLRAWERDNRDAGGSPVLQGQILLPFLTPTAWEAEKGQDVSHDELPWLGSSRSKQLPKISAPQASSGSMVLSHHFFFSQPSPALGSPWDVFEGTKGFWGTTMRPHL